MNIAIAAPLPNTIPQDFPRTLTGIISYTKAHLKDLDQLHYFDKSGVRTDRNRNIILEQALARDIDYILWLDVDMIYPYDIICKYLENDFDVMGCLYFKRAEPFSPIGYIKGDNPAKPYKPLDPRLLPEDTVIEVDALGFGGMMVNMNVYKTMGEDKWMKYSDNFHLPYETDEPKFTHDILFCKTAQEYGAKIMLHTGVKPAHMGEIAIVEKHWEWERNEVGEENKPSREPRIAVIMPTIHTKLARKTRKILEKRAGMPCDVYALLDTKKNGYVSVCNAFVRNNPDYDYYVTATDDIFPSRNWLKNAYELMKSKGAKLVGFNDGKWEGRLACCALIDGEWMMKNYGGNVYFSGYFGHYNDTELTLIAMQDGVYAFDPNIIFMEIDYEKESKGVRKEDKALFSKRVETGFDGRVTRPDLLQAFS